MGEVMSLQQIIEHLVFPTGFFYFYLHFIDRKKEADNLLKHFSELLDGCFFGNKRKVNRYLSKIICDLYGNYVILTIERKNESFSKEEYTACVGFFRGVLLEYPSLEDIQLEINKLAIKFNENCNSLKDITKELSKLLLFYSPLMNVLSENLNLTDVTAEVEDVIKSFFNLRNDEYDLIRTIFVEYDKLHKYLKEDFSYFKYFEYLKEGKKNRIESLLSSFFISSFEEWIDKRTIKNIFSYLDISEQYKEDLLPQEVYYILRRKVQDFGGV